MKTATKKNPGTAATASTSAPPRRKAASRPVDRKQRSEAEPKAPGTPARARRRSASSAGKAQAGLGFNPLKQVLWARPGFMVRRLHQIHDALFYRECQTHNITPVQFGILTALSMNPWLDQKAIGDELALDRTTTADVLKRLEEKGLIERRVNPDDRRSRLSVITKAGLQTLSNLHQGMLTAGADLLAPLSESNRLVFLKLLAQLVGAHETVDHEQS